MQADLVIAGRDFDMSAAITDRQDKRDHVILGMDIRRTSGFHANPSKDAAPGGAAKKPLR